MISQRPPHGTTGHHTRRRAVNRAIESLLRNGAGVDWIAVQTDDELIAAARPYKPCGQCDCIATTIQRCPECNRKLCDVCIRRYPQDPHGLHSGHHCEVRGTAGGAQLFSAHGAGFRVAVVLVTVVSIADAAQRWLRKRLRRRQGDPCATDFRSHLRTEVGELGPNARPEDLGDAIDRALRQNEER